MSTNTITVKELREQLDGLDDECLVYFQMKSGCCNEYEPLEKPDVQKYEPCERYNEPGCVVITVNQLPGYRSCIQAGKTKKLDNEYWNR